AHKGQSSCPHSPAPCVGELATGRDVHPGQGREVSLYRAVDRHGQTIDVLLTEHRDTAAARCFLTKEMRCNFMSFGATPNTFPRSAGRPRVCCCHGPTTGSSSRQLPGPHSRRGAKTAV